MVAELGLLTRLGSVPCIVVTSPELAKEFLKTHELSFINRSETTAVEKMTYNASFAFAAETPNSSTSASAVTPSASTPSPPYDCAYDCAARAMRGVKARTNFVYPPTTQDHLVPAFTFHHQKQSQPSVKYHSTARGYGQIVPNWPPFATYPRDFSGNSDRSCTTANSANSNTASGSAAAKSGQK